MSRFLCPLRSRFCKAGRDPWGRQDCSFRHLRAGICIAAAGLGMMAFGIYRGEMPVVLEKAIHICMECIGIG